MSDVRPLLLGIFNQLRAEGLPLSVRSYLDAMQALEFVEPFVTLRGVRAADGVRDGRTKAARSSADRIRDREELVWFCQVLWARTPEEEHLVRTVITQRVGLPDAALTMRLYDHVRRRSTTQDVFVEKPPPVPDPPTPPTSSSIEEKVGTAQGPGEDTTAPPEETIGAELDDDGETTLPVVGDLVIPGRNRFSMQAQPLISPLWLTALWRRLFMPKKTFDRTRIDANETVRDVARKGVITAPRYAVVRVNTARLLVLMDVSAKMQPWYAFQEVMRQTLLEGGSRLERIRILYFMGAPGQRVYQKRELRRGIPWEKLAGEVSGWPVLIFGEAGAIAAERHDHDARLASFFATAGRASLRPIVWINPMPEQRWTEAFRALKTAHPHTHLVPLSSESLLRAVDLLRGVVTR